MVIKSDGTKWACQSCLKGHRVSGCTHTDRELTLVPKKGRPVTQCHHCRQERKKRSAHVSCHCGEADKPHHPKEKCIHLREAEERVKAGCFLREDRAAESPEKTAGHLAAVAEEQGCCCHHGGACTCAMLKKEVPAESHEGPAPAHGPAVKPRLETAKSDGHLTVFQNGHHKPVHRKNHAAHECGMPYKMPMPRAHTDQSVHAQARRSVDSLALDSSNAWLRPAAFPSQASTPFGLEPRISPSERPKQLSRKNSDSGVVGDAPAQDQPRLDDMDFNDLGSFPTGQTQPQHQPPPPPSSASSDAFTYMSMEPMSAVTDGTFDIWSMMPSADSASLPNNNPFGVWPTTTDVTGMAQPALTAASSGTQSESDEIPPIDDLYSFGMPSIQEDVANVDTSMGMTSPSSNRRSLPADFKPFDLVNPDVGGDWQQSALALLGGEPDALLKPDNDAPPLGFGDPWQTPAHPVVKDLPYRGAAGAPAAGRPTSRSLGPSNAPTDIMKQLFPEIDVPSSLFDSPSNGYSPSRAKDAAAAATSTTPMDFCSVNESLDFTSQQWTDGSVSIPNDTFTSAYDLHEDFSNPDFSGKWPQ